MVTQDLAHGALMGARGNSGVILSQIWRGFAKALGDKEILDGPSLVLALEDARDVAYKGVVRPVEGTILTVAKDMASAARKALEVTEDPFMILFYAVVEAEESVERTPELLDVLKEAGDEWLNDVESFGKTAPSIMKKISEAAFKDRP